MIPRAGFISQGCFRKLAGIAATRDSDTICLDIIGVLEFHRRLGLIQWAKNLI